MLTPISRSNRADMLMCPPSGVNFTALLSRLNRTWRALRSSPRRGGNVAGASISAENPASLIRGPIRRTAADALGKIEDVFVKFEHTRLDLAEIEDFVDHIEEVGPARVNIDDVGTITVVSDRSQNLLLDHVRETDYRVERGPQLMADRAKEGRFRAISGVGLIFGLTQRRLVADALANVAHNAVNLHRPRFRIGRVGQARLDPNVGSILAPPPISDWRLVSVFGQPTQRLLHAGVIIGMDYLARTEGYCLFGFIAIEATTGW